MLGSTGSNARGKKDQIDELDSKRDISVAKRQAKRVVRHCSFSWRHCVVESHTYCPSRARPNTVDERGPGSLGV